MKILVTGGAGFIGCALSVSLARAGHQVVIIDNLNSYYDPRLKVARLQDAGIIIPDNLPRAKACPSTGSERGEVEYPDIPFGMRLRSVSFRYLEFIRADITDYAELDALFEEGKFDCVVNLAAQAGVRYSIENPHAYVESNVVGFLNILECCRKYPVAHLVYASSSSVYGGNGKIPFSEADRVDNPVSLYAATKKSNELFASVYSHLYGIPCTGLRFFTVYGPWGRPDMAPMLFSDAISTGTEIRVFNEGNLSRDFTYIDDIVKGIEAVIAAPAPKDTPALYNIGCGHPVQLMDFIHTLEKALGKKAKLKMEPMQPGDVYTTYADTTSLSEATGYAPATRLEEGIARFAEWYAEYNGIAGE